ncbi:MAG: Triosephosphate isomerase [Phycisphaerae bacterium]|nr:Triosephosphate isomerase [Phycisphaerae bacterium]
MRTPYIVGNWKMNPTTAAEAISLAKGVVDGLQGVSGVEVGVAPPAILVSRVMPILDKSPVRLGMQNAYYESSGAFTGEISLPMIRDAGASFVIIGHSERRQYFHETGPLLAKKVAAVLAANLQVIYCIGETLQQRDNGETFKVLEQQLREVLSAGLNWSAVTIAYEPVWAIGTGRNATPDQAQEAHAFIRQWLRTTHGPATAEMIRLQYGGSVKAGNAAELLAQPDVDGALVGGASLKSDEFLGIIRAAK